MLFFIVVILGISVLLFGDIRSADWHGFDGMFLAFFKIALGGISEQILCWEGLCIRSI